MDDGCFEDGRTGWGLIIMVDDCHALMSNLRNVSVKYSSRQNNVAAHNLAS